MDLIFFLKLSLNCLILFVLGAFCFDIVHYLLHVFETSRFRFLRWLASFHAVHHDFLDRRMQIQRRYSLGNIILHVIPEYLTAVIGICLLGYLFFGWLPALIVIAVRSVMVVIYIFQKGEDFTHRPLTRIKGKRSLIFVGPQYHALHHVYPRQYYSSFVNIFDMIFGTNCQIKDRSFLILGSSPIISRLSERLVQRGAVIESVEGLDLDASIARSEVVIISEENKDLPDLIERIKELGKSRLLPPEVWNLELNHTDRKANFKKTWSYFSDEDVTYRYILCDAPRRVDHALFFLKRGFRLIPLSATEVFSSVAFKLRLTK